MTLSERYAKALYQLASESNSESKVLKDVQIIFEAFSSSRELASVFLNPVVHSDKKVKISESLFKNKISDLSLSFIRLIIQKKRTLALMDICKSYEIVYKKNKYIKDVYITSSYSLEGPEKEILEKNLKSKISGIPLFHYSVNTNIIGGFIINFDGVQLDMSIRGMLNKLKKNFDKTSITLN
jgi:F-type H+-transporting ATPase subunit delta